MMSFCCNLKTLIFEASILNSTKEAIMPVRRTLAASNETVISVNDFSFLCISRSVTQFGKIINADKIEKLIINRVFIFILFLFEKVNFVTLYIQLFITTKKAIFHFLIASKPSLTTEKIAKNQCSGNSLFITSAAALHSPAARAHSPRLRETAPTSHPASCAWRR